MINKGFNIGKVPRNDIEAARKYYMQSKPLQYEEYEMLVMLQDSAKEILKVMKDEEWEILP